MCVRASVCTSTRTRLAPLSPPSSPQTSRSRTLARLLGSPFASSGLSPVRLTARPRIRRAGSRHLISPATCSVNVQDKSVPECSSPTSPKDALAASSLPVVGGSPVLRSCMRTTASAFRWPVTAQPFDCPDPARSLENRDLALEVGVGLSRRYWAGRSRVVSVPAGDSGSCRERYSQGSRRRFRRRGATREPAGPLGGPELVL
jgi:hypothetical protein